MLHGKIANILTIISAVCLGVLQDADRGDVIKKHKVSYGWLHTVLKQTGLKARKGTHDPQKLPSNWPTLVEDMCFRAANMIAEYQITSALFFNLDEFGIPLLLTSKYTRVIEGTNRVGVLAGDDKRQITGTNVVTARGK